ncbi:hypothetical protein CDA63_12765 [Hymenobacter amundsenii]|uniref:LTD domain-containing protein n=1 Tax=Hymenobacter amundsenii TaxID=2006685 RepID=A0A246FJM6_9BACT|nr:lamin tail domain-containing protein [Hymenobacter amundsenii]OWP62775.1 hypothetical protein CDA63_12765 [Hymenobacter amundsenii]
MKYLNFSYGSWAFRRLLVSLLLLLLLVPGIGWGQTNPTPHNLALGAYEFRGFNDATSTNYPVSLQGHSFTSEPDATTVSSPNADAALVAGGAVTSSNIRNEGANGVSVLGSGTNTIGAVTLGLNTTGRAQVLVSWVASVISPGGRANGLRLQYRLGQTGSFTEVADTKFEGNASGQSMLFNAIALPEAVNDQPVVQIRWLYYSLPGGGTRTRIGLDEVMVTSSVGPSVAAPTISSFTPVAGPVGTVVTINGTGFVKEVSVGFNGTDAIAVSVVSATQLRATVPAGSSTGPITVALGNKTSSSATNFTVESLVGRVVISQLYGGGGNVGATYKNDFVELYNRSAAAVSLAGWSVQYAAANNGTFSTVNSETLPATASIPAGSYFLLQLAGATGAIGASLPTPDFTGTTRLSASNGKIALASSNTLVTGPTSTNVVDFVGYGTSTQAEGGNSTGAIANASAAIRKANGCQDTNDNRADFDIKTPVPRNSATAVVLCNSPLPVELLTFGAERVMGGVRLRWVTAFERNSARFELQRSASGQVFQTIATVAGQGNTASHRNYTAQDRQPLPGVSYYRLHQVDTDGKEAYSAVVSLAASGEWQLYPDPASVELTLVAPVAIVNYRVISLAGRVVLVGEAPSGIAVLDVAALPAGVYQLEVTTAAGSQIRKFLKQ